MKSLSHVRHFVTPWTVAHQATPSMEFSRQKYLSGLPFPSPGDLPPQGTNPGLQHCWQTLYRLSHQGIPVISNSLWPHGVQNARLPCPSLSPRIPQTHVHWAVILPKHHILYLPTLLLLPSIFHSIMIWYCLIYLFNRWRNWNLKGLNISFHN